MGKTLSELHQEVRGVLQDVFEAGVEIVWTDEEIDQHIQDILIDLSQASPYQSKLSAESDGTKKINLTSITDLNVEDLISVVKAEYEGDQDPEQFRNVSRFGDIVTLKIESAPTSGDDIYLYCNLVHTLDETSSTLNRLQESLLVKGVTGQLAISKSKKYIDMINIGGTSTPTQLYNWGSSRLAEYNAGKKRLARVRVYEQYSES